MFCVLLPFLPFSKSSEEMKPCRSPGDNGYARFIRSLQDEVMHGTSIRERLCWISVQLKYQTKIKRGKRAEDRQWGIYEDKANPLVLFL